MVTVEGTVQRLGRGGHWLLLSRSGTYELSGAPPDLLRPDQRVVVKGEIRAASSLAGFGPWLKVTSFELLKP